MPKQYQPLEFNTFVKGIITQASPLTFPENASIDEDNFVLNRDGSRDRRLGMDFENDHQIITTGVPFNTPNLQLSTFNWKNPGGDSSKELVVVQVGNELRFFNVLAEPVSANLIASFAGVAQDTVRCSYAVVDGYLVVATGVKQISIFAYDGVTVSRTEQILYIRDTFGVVDIEPGTGLDLSVGNNIAIRPTTLTNNHLYNLRNQGWLEKRYWALLREEDPVYAFSYTNNYTSGFTAYPSNADHISIVLAARPDITGAPTLERFFPEDLIQNALGTSQAAVGFFVIDAMDRGSSRYAETVKLQAKNIIKYPLSPLNQDSTPGGASIVSQYSGRVFFSGFKGEVIDGDARSPKMSSYILFSQLVSNIEDIGKCYAEGDPTSRLEADPLETDGGTIRIDGAYNIRALIPVAQFLMVVAENGVWRIRGGSDYGFSATNYSVEKMVEVGAINQSAIVIVENMFFFWGKDGIYQCAPNQFGDYEVTNITKNTISQYYDNISFVDKSSASGQFDSFARTIRWIYNNRLDDLAENTKELVFDLELGAFYPSTIGSITSGIPKVIASLEVPPYFEGTSQTDVTASGIAVTASGIDVTVRESIRSSGQRETLYLCVTELSPIKFTFSSYSDSTFTDWKTYNGVGVDAPAFMLTGYMTGGDSMRNKQVPYIYFHFKKTETGFEEIVGDLVPTNQSSCIVQSQWEWANHLNSGKWGVPFQAYRHKRFWMPPTDVSQFDNGFSTVVSKNKLRGRGRALSLLISTEPHKDCRLLGWGMMVGVDGNV